MNSRDILSKEELQMLIGQPSKSGAPQPEDDGKSERVLFDMPSGEPSIMPAFLPRSMRHRKKSTWLTRRNGKELKQ